MSEVSPLLALAPALNVLDAEACKITAALLQM